MARPAPEKDAPQRFDRHPQVSAILRPFTPTLYAKDILPLKFQATSHLVIVAFSDTDWKGFWGLTDADAEDLMQRIDGHRKGDGKLTFEEISKFTADPQNRAFIETLPSSIRGILVPDIVKDAIREIDGSSKADAALDMKEWTLFLDSLESKHSDFLLQKSLTAFQAFFGRGQPWWQKQETGEHRDMTIDDMYAAAGLTYETGNSRQLLLAHTSEDKSSRVAAPLTPGTMQCGLVEGSLFPSGWCSDLFYYSANNHPLHGIFAADPGHPLSPCERVVMELAVLGFSLFTAMLRTRWVDDGKAPKELLKEPMVFGLLVVTIPGMVVFWTLFFLFTCPKCGMVDASNATDAAVRRAACFQKLGRAIAFLLITVSFAFVVLSVKGMLHFDFELPINEELVLYAIGSRLKSYVISWLLMVFVYFNPLVAWGQPDPKGGCSLGDFIGLGQWRIERQRFQLRVFNVLQVVHPAHAEARKKALPRAQRDGGWSWIITSCRGAKKALPGQRLPQGYSVVPAQ